MNFFPTARVQGLADQSVPPGQVPRSHFYAYQFVDICADCCNQKINKKCGSNACFI